MTDSSSPPSSDELVCSVCIANYNGGDILDDCLESVFNQAGNVSMEVIVHDDASTDDSLQILRARYPQVRLLASSTNVGYCISNNRMVEQAAGKYVLLLNNDAALFPDALQALLAAAQKGAPREILTLPQYDWASGRLVDRGCLLDPFYNPVPIVSDVPWRKPAMTIGACLWISKQTWAEAGGFPEWMESVGEDLYLCCTARLLGCGVHALDVSGYRHRQGASFGGNKAVDGRLKSTYRRRRFSERNKTATMMICTPTPVMWPLLAVHITLLAAEACILAIASADLRLINDVYLSAMGACWKLRAEIFQRRAVLQNRRRISTRAYFSTFTWMPRKLSMLKRYGLPTVDSR